jgi:hypothetical protein
MNEETFYEDFAAPVNRWRNWLQRHRLTSVVLALLHLAEPFALFGAQVLYIAQPAAGLFIESRKISDWAHFLETPGSVNWLRQQLEAPAEGLSDNITEDTDGNFAG